MSKPNGEPVIINELVVSLWKQYVLAWWVNVLLPLVALIVLTVAPVANKEWPYLLAFFWLFYVTILICEIRDYCSKREVCMALLYEQTPEWVKRYLP